ncbi:MAG: 3-methyl-2-oxobutanoate dehydrogenase subunit beta, partial [Cyanobacteriota bacterium]
ELDGCDDADLVITSFGSCARIVKSAIKEARNQGMKVGLMRPITLWPFPRKIMHDISERCPLILDIEMNMGQMLQDVKMFKHGGARIEFYGRPGGGIPTPEEILAKIKETIELKQKV